MIIVKIQSTNLEKAMQIAPSLNFYLRDFYKENATFVCEFRDEWKDKWCDGSQLSLAVFDFANNEIDYDKVKNLLNWTIVNKVTL
jgi:hypothetical protein